MEDIFYRQMPHSLEAEQSVIGSMLIDANCVKDVMEQLRPDDFYLKQNREIFETIYSMFVYSKPIDGVTVAGEMEKNGTYEESTTRPYLAQLMDVTPTSANVMEYVGIVRDKALLRALYTVAGEISTMVQDGTGGASSVLDAAEQKIYAVRRGRSAQSMASIGVVLQGVLHSLLRVSTAFCLCLRRFSRLLHHRFLCGHSLRTDRRRTVHAYKHQSPLCLPIPPQRQKIHFRKLSENVEIIFKHSIIIIARFMKKVKCFFTNTHFAL